MPTGDCFCGCGEEAGIGRWFVQGHDITAAGALRAVEGGLSLPQRLVEAGFGPERSVVQEAVDQAGWVRCGRCSYAGTPAGLATHTRTGSCALPEDRGGKDEGDGAVTPQPAAEGASPAAGQGTPREAEPSEPGSAPPVRAETGAARGRLLPGEDDPSWGEVPLHLRQALRIPAHQLVTPVRGPLKAKEQRRVLSAVRAAQRMRMTGAHWLTLLTTERDAFGSPSSARAGAFYEALEQILAEHLPPTQDQQDEPAVPEEADAG
ncbi:hypothetical protein ABZ023_33910 [Streptomyces sp. NPDC006367]|uniref:hypothetical protein n=1 Tax=Streptomyces sp. NPDC006367 TaxID=3156759 RepID=UPI0033AD9871